MSSGSHSNACSGRMGRRADTNSDCLLSRAAVTTSKLSGVVDEVSMGSLYEERSQSVMEDLHEDGE